jgi:uncharacterized protein (DUF1697 family)
MKTFISILRGINVSGNNMIKMDALHELYGELKFTNIETYIQSGNVVFQSRASDGQELARQISKKLLQKLSATVPVLVLEPNEFKILAKNNPFIKRKEDTRFLHVTFLSEAPKKEDVGAIQKNLYGPDEFEVSGKAVYLFCPGGYGKTKLNNTFFEKKLKVTATTRNLNTVLKLLEMTEMKGAGKG